MQISSSTSRFQLNAPDDVDDEKGRDAVYERRGRQRQQKKSVSKESETFTFPSFPCISILIELQ